MSKKQNESKDKQKAPAAPKPASGVSRTEANKARRIAKDKAAKQAAASKPDSRGLTRLQKRAKVRELKHELAVAIAFESVKKAA